MASLLDVLRCGRCDRTHDPHRVQTTCNGCGGPLLAAYRLAQGMPPLEKVLARPPGQFRLHELCPVQTGSHTPTLGEGATPLLLGERLGDELGLRNLRIKDESQNPTGSFKSRGMAVAMARARELGVHEACLPTAGNAGGAAAAYGALLGLTVHVRAPIETPEAILTEMRALGAHLEVVDGTIADAGRELAPLAAENGWFNLATLREPYRIEGKKVMGYELLYDLGRLPDVVIYPTGGGTGLIGMWKAFDEMEALGWIGPSRPRMVAVQTIGCAPIVRAFNEGLTEAPAWENPAPTAAYGLRVPAALGDFLILKAVRESDGTAIAVSEELMAKGSRLLARKLGIQGAVEGGACVAAADVLKRKGMIGADDVVVVFNTGHALKYLDWKG